MKKNIRRILSITAAAAMTASLYTGCAAEDNYKGDTGQNIPHENIAPAEEYGDNYTYDEAETGGEILTPPMPSYNEDYHGYIESGFKNPETEPLSTFSADVDTASYSNVRRLLEDCNYVPEDAVRVEEFINYFNYNYDSPEKGEKFSRYAELADCPWDNSHKLMMLGIQGERLDREEMPDSNIVFLIDSSGSMSAYNKLPLVQSAFSMLAEKLSPNDRVSIVTYAGSSEVVLAGAKGSDKDRILEALYSINASGCTNGEGGINSAYDLAEEFFIEGGNNRVILATDGDLNVGATSEDELVKLIEKKRQKGIYLSVLGFGTGNYKDDKLEAIADNGNGNYSYIDSVDEARRVLVEEMGGTLFTIAKDVKIQVEFNPAQVKSYRLIGYDNRLMDAEDFYDSSKDAGEVGADHSVTALYEIELADSGTYHGIPLEFADQLAEPIAEKKSDAREELCKFSVTYKDVDTDESVYLSDLFGMETYRDKPSERMTLAGAAAEFALVLKNSEYKGDASFDHAHDAAMSLSDRDDRIEELAELIALAKKIYS